MNSLIRSSTDPPLRLRLNRDLVRSIKRGHPWVYAEALRERPAAPAGSVAVLLDHRQGREIAGGFYDPHSSLAVRVCTVCAGETLDDVWAGRRFEAAWNLRRGMLDDQTNAFRLLNGEGDGVPGLVADVYGDTAVLKLDGDGPRGFWSAEGIAQWLAERLGVNCVFERFRERGREGRTLLGTLSSQPVPIREHGASFTVDVVLGQKTGFFLDQRENRQLVRQFAAGRRVLNLFSYTGGFSVAAGLGGARHVTTVDIAAPAIDAARQHWTLNALPAERHEALAADVFPFLEQAVQRGDQWDLVISDPPSFAPSKATVQSALGAYRSLLSQAAAITSGDGLLAAASCSSHIELPVFMDVIQEAVASVRRRATVLAITGQPPDHPSPLLLPEFRYLKFVLVRIEV